MAMKLTALMLLLGSLPQVVPAESHADNQTNDTHADNHTDDNHADDNHTDDNHTADHNHTNGTHTGHDDHDKKDDHAGHGHSHGAKPFEWAALFHYEEGNYTWKINTPVPEEHMKMVIFQTTGKDQAALEGVEEDAEKIFENNTTSWTEVDSGETIALPTTGESKAYDLHIHGASTFMLNLEEHGNFVFFCQHKPSEFPGSKWFQDADGKDVAPLVEEVTSTETDTSSASPRFTPFTLASTFVLALAFAVAEA